VQLLNDIHYGLKFAPIKATVHNYVTIPDQISKSIIAKIEALLDGSNTGTAARPSPSKNGQDNAQIAIANKKAIDEELQRQRTNPNTAAQDESTRIEEKNRAARQLADEIAREQAIKEAKAAKLAAEEAIKAANAAKLQAEQLAEKNRLIAKAEKERVENEKAEKERAIQLRNQKDEDPLEAYRRSMSN
jgi:hypothetical protein